MADFKLNPNVNFTVTITVSEEEARALDALAGYGDNVFIEKFYELGEHYMKPNEQGLREFLNSVRSTMPSVLKKINQARKVAE